MSAQHSITFSTSPWIVVISIAIVAVAAGFGYTAWKRSGFLRSIGRLELLRITIVALAAVVLNQPEWIEEYRPSERPSIAVLIDRSPSMETQDVAPPTGAGVAVTRNEAAAPLASQQAWHALSENMNVVITPIAAGDDSNGTNLYEPLAEAPDKVANLVGVVLVSDGDWTSGPPPVQAATRLRLKNIPVFTVPVGSPTRLPDIELLSVDAPTFGIVNKAVRVPFTIESSLPRDYTATVTLQSSDGEAIEREVRIAAMGRTSDAVHWKPKTIGKFTLTLTVPRNSEELLPENNQRSAPIEIREERLRVLVVDSLPRWEYRYLRNALSRDPGVDVSCLLFHPGLNKVGGGNKDYIKEFPNGLDELSKFDVVFLGDVGLDDGQLTAEQCHWLKGLVEFQASGLVLMPGLQGRQNSLLTTELKDIYPVVLDEAQPGGWGSRLPGHFELTELGRRSLLTKLADVQDENSEVWESLPGFQWYAPVVRAKAGAEVLCVHKDAANEFGRLPLLVTQTYGAGKVLFMGTDGAWRWRKGVEDKYHYRFWGQVVRWMAYQRHMAPGETMRFYYSPEQPQLHQTVMFNANVMERTGEPLAKGDVIARIVAPSGKADTVRMTALGEEWGAYSGRFTADEPGTHQVTLSCKQTAATIETTMFVHGAATEPVGKPARPEVLEEIAKVTRGQVVAKQNVSEIVRWIAQLPPPAPLVHRLQLWSHPLVIAVFVTLLGAFWIARKVAGLI
ncbi:MAG: hypothetical protein IT427_03690 [Pirellulales bacterium]|nr:hypothetical protein [Pirellulales bacterium]